MKTVELFCGTKSFSKVAAENGHSTFTVDYDPQFFPDLCKDLLRVSESELPNDVDILWASPPCQCFSVASIGRHWTGGHRVYEPKSADARIAKDLVRHTMELINAIKPKVFIIENPRGVLRKLGLIPIEPRTAWYCQYGDTRAKPTDIWTNLPNWTPKTCRNGSKDHQEARRGAKTGTQGLRGATDRSVVPAKLCQELLNAAEDYILYLLPGALP